MLIILYIRKTTKKLESSLSPSDSAGLAREKLDELKSTHKGPFQLLNRDYLTRTCSMLFTSSSARQSSRRLHFSTLNFHVKLAREKLDGLKSTHKAFFQLPNRDYLMITLLFHYIFRTTRQRSRRLQALTLDFHVKLAQVDTPAYYS
jgi:hypothetical protein